MLTIIVGFETEWINAIGEKLRDKNTRMYDFPETKLHPNKQPIILYNILGLERQYNSIIKTHSNVYISVCGHLVAEHALQKNELKVVIANSVTDYSVSNYDDEGMLENWPYGFFSWDSNTHLNEFIKIIRSTR